MVHKCRPCKAFQFGDVPSRTIREIHLLNLKGGAGKPVLDGDDIRRIGNGQLKVIKRTINPHICRSHGRIDLD